MKKALDLIWIAIAKSFIRWFSGLPLWGKALAGVSVLMLAGFVGIPAAMGAFVLWVGYKLTLGKLI